MPATIRDWLVGVDVRFAEKHGSTFEQNFSTTEDIKVVARELGTDNLFSELCIVALTDRVKLRKAIETMLNEEVGLIASGPASTSTGLMGPDEKADKAADEDSVLSEPFLLSEARATGEPLEPWEESEELSAAASAIEQALAANGAPYSCQRLTVSADDDGASGNKEEVALLAVVAHKGLVETQYGDKQWASVRLQATMLPSDLAEALVPAAAATAVPSGKLEYKPTYRPQHTTLTKVRAVRVQRRVPSVDEALAAVEELERAAADKENLRAFLREEMAACQARGRAPAVAAN